MMGKEKAIKANTEVKENTSAKTTENLTLANSLWTPCLKRKSLWSNYGHQGYYKPE